MERNVERFFSYSNLVPNFSSYSTLMHSKVWALQIDSLNRTLQYLGGTKFYSFFIFEDDCAKSLRVVHRKYKKNRYLNELAVL